MDTKSIREVLKGRRGLKGWTLKQLSRESGVSTTHIGRIERGERFPSGCVLRKLAGPLDLTETELFKVAGYLTRDVSDDTLDRFKKEIKREIADTLANLLKKIDNL